MRVALDSASDLPAIASAVSAAGGLVMALDVVEPIEGRMVVDVTCNAVDEGHAEVIKAAAVSYTHLLRDPGRLRPDRKSVV